MKQRSKTKGIQRIPRPIGTTEKAFHYNKHQSQENKQKLLNHIIQHYITNNFLYCERHYSIEQLSTLLNVPTQNILSHTMQYGNNIQATMDKLTNGDSLRALFAFSISASLDDRSRAIEQYSILRASQGESYKAFISGEVNKALKLVMETGQNLGSITKGLTGGGTNINMLFQGAQQGPTAGEDYMTVDKAVAMIKEQGVQPLSLNEAQKQSIFEEHDIAGTPEVCALKQEGVDTSKEALNLKTLTDFTIEHEDRRAEEVEVDLDADHI